MYPHDETNVKLGDIFSNFYSNIYALSVISMSNLL